MFWFRNRIIIHNFALLSGGIKQQEDPPKAFEVKNMSIYIPLYPRRLKQMHVSGKADKIKSLSTGLFETAGRSQLI